MRWHDEGFRSRLGRFSSSGCDAVDFRGGSLSRRPFYGTLLVALLALLAALLAGPKLVRTYWTRKSSNPVRRGVARARQLGCFSCHGDLGSTGLKDPGVENLEVPAWSGGMYMMYVKSDEDIHAFILNGSVPKVEAGDASSNAGGSPPQPAVTMPAFRAVLSGTDLEDLTAAYKVLAQMSAPPSGSSAERGMQLARTWQCFSCHGPGGSGGLPNPGSFTGFIPGWYGADFKDLVRDRGEFDSWVRRGRIDRLDANPVASYFVKRQRLSMPSYRRMSDSDLGDLWAYADWLAKTGGGAAPSQGVKP